jgi:hypothetical protein
MNGFQLNVNRNRPLQGAAVEWSGAMLHENDICDCGKCDQSKFS